MANEAATTSNASVRIAIRKLCVQDHKRSPHMDPLQPVASSSGAGGGGSAAAPDATGVSGPTEAGSGGVTPTVRPEGVESDVKKRKRALGCRTLADFDREEKAIGEGTFG